MLDYETYKELHELVRSVDLYYRQGKPQNDIAELLGIAQSKVSRLLKKAHDEGYCTVTFNFPPLLEISSRIAERYDLRYAIVIPTGEQENLKENLGQAAARYFEHFIAELKASKKQSKLSVGLSCGLTLFQMVNQIRATKKDDSSLPLKIYPLAADNTYQAVNLFPSTLTGMLAAKFDSQAEAFALPAQILESLTTDAQVQKRRKEILDHSEAGKIFKQAENVDLAFIGLGKISKETLGFCSLAERYNISAKDLKKMGAVAEYNYVPIDEDGNPLIEKEGIENKDKLQSIANRIVCVSLNQIRESVMERKKLVVCIAGGADKVMGIRAVLRHRLANILITDSQTAEMLLGK